MTAISDSRFPRFARGCAAALVLGAAPLALAQDVPIIQPGAPGAKAKVLSAEQAIKIADTRYTPDDVQFMQDMIPHHNQAVQMAALVAERTNRPELIDLAGRINASQADEIEFMQGWLRERGEKVPEPTAHQAMHTSHKMAGMASPEQLEALAAADATGFDRLFLQLMIPHHEGAVKMVRDLLAKPGSAYDPVLFDFANDITKEQNGEIERMNALLVSLSADPRAGLTAGFRDAGQAQRNLQLVAALPKAPGFFDPENPAGMPPIKPKKEKKDEAGAKPSGEAGAAEGAESTKSADGEAAAAPAGEKTADVAAGGPKQATPAAPRDPKEQSNEGTEWGERSPLLSFANSDLAFSGDKLVAGSYHGFNVYQLGKDGVPALFSSVVCPGGQGDVSVVGNLLIMSVEQTRGRVDCGLQGVDVDASPERFRGLRIFDISDPARPKQVGQVQTCRGSHTHSVVSGAGPEGKIIVYNSGTASVRDDEEMAGCIGDVPGDERTALFRIDVIEIPVKDPSKARIVASPAVFADEESGRLAGLWRGGDHGDDTQETSRTDQCHDITVFPDRRIAAGACSGNGIIFDISDPLNPKRIDVVSDKGFAYWHSATFNNDGTKVIFTDEWGGGSRPRCRAYDRKDWGADAIYDIVNRKLEFRSHYKLAAPQVEQENCVAHNGSIVPVPGRDIFVQAWYQGGLSVMDFTDSANPVEIAYFDRGPVHEKRLVLGGYWSTYWYGGKIYGTEIARGLDVFALQPSDDLSENEIAAAALADQGRRFNPQQQFPVSWPAEPVVARAYIDQLRRSDALSGETVTELDAALQRAAARLKDGRADLALAAALESVSRRLPQGDRGVATVKRLTALSDTLGGIAARLRGRGTSAGD